MVAADADRAELGQPGDDAVRLRAVADDVTEVPDRVDRADRGEHRIEGDEVAVDVRQDRDAHAHESSSAPLTTAGVCARPGRADTPADAPARGGDHEPMAVEPRHVDRDDLDRAAAERVDRPFRGRQLGARCRPASRRRGSRPERAAGSASSTRSARPATARAVTAGQRRDGGGRAASASARTARRLDVAASPVALDHRRQEGGLLGDRLEQQRPRGGQGRGERQPRVAAARPEVDEPVDAALAQDPDGASGCRRRGPIATAAGSRIAVRLIALVQASSRRA